MTVPLLIRTLAPEIPLDLTLSLHFKPKEVL